MMLSFLKVLSEAIISKAGGRPRIEEVLRVAHEPENCYDRYIRHVSQEAGIVGHMPRQWGRIFYYFLLHGG